ncbi:MAG: helix-turn-helix domain-containing protein [Patescibacteria group bacterium]
MPPKTIITKDFYSVSELADLLGISRIAVFKKIQKGQIKAFKIGRNYVIPKKELGAVLGVVLSEKDKAMIDKAIMKTIKEYGETLKLLGAE